MGVLDDDGNTFTGTVRIEWKDIREQATICCRITGPLKVGGCYEPYWDVCFDFSEQAEAITVEYSATSKFLPLKSGYFACFQSVFLTVEGRTKEITTDSMRIGE